ncbi:MAG TPA: hypothetical protein VGD99_08415 [Anaerolineae bacterium]|jgi:hypothetical protein
MEQILITVKDKEKAKVLLELLAALDFVDSVNASSSEEMTEGESADFFALAGLWEGRDITLETIRQQAWPRQHNDTV